MRLSESGSDADRALEVRQRIARTTKAQQRVAGVELGGREVGTQCDGIGIARDSFIQAAEFPERDTEFVVCLGARRPDGQRAAIAIHRTVAVAFLDEQIAEIGVKHGGTGECRDTLLGDFLRARCLAALGQLQAEVPECGLVH